MGLGLGVGVGVGVGVRVRNGGLERACLTLCLAEEVGHHAHLVGDRARVRVRGRVKVRVG